MHNLISSSVRRKKLCALCKEQSRWLVRYIPDLVEVTCLNIMSALIPIDGFPNYEENIMSEQKATGKVPASLADNLASHTLHDTSLHNPKPSIQVSKARACTKSSEEHTITLCPTHRAHASVPQFTAQARVFQKKPDSSLVCATVTQGAQTSPRLSRMKKMIARKFLAVFVMAVMRRAVVESVRRITLRNEFFATFSGCVQ